MSLDVYIFKSASMVETLFVIQQIIRILKLGKLL